MSNTVGLDFEAHYGRGRLKHELWLCCFAALYISLYLLSAMATDVLNMVPVALAAGGLSIHIVTLLTRYMYPQKHWLAVIGIVSDCLFFALAHPDVQILTWEDIWTPLGFHGRPKMVASNQEESMLCTFLFFVFMSYATHFALLFRHAVMSIVAGSAIYWTFLVWVNVSRVVEMKGKFLMSAHRIAELLFLLLAFATQIAAKKITERQARELFGHLSEARTTFYQEKVLRCEAEFKIEKMKEAGQPRRNPEVESTKSSYLAGSFEHIQKDSTDAPRTAFRTPPSHYSAPSRLMTSVSAFLEEAIAMKDKTECGEGSEDGLCSMDCFPVDATVWVQGSTTPLPVGQLQAGQKVMCYDMIGGSVKYADATRVSVDATVVEWVDVAMADGTHLTMTSDHPIRPLQRAKGDRADLAPGRVVKAEDLSPGQHEIMVHRVVTVPVEVAQVTVAPAQESPMQRVSVSVSQPDRHCILVASPATGMDVRAVAVGSSDVQQALDQQHRPNVKGTFVEVPSPMVQLPRRPASEPPRDRGRGAADAAGEPAARAQQVHHAEPVGASSSGQSSGGNSGTSVASVSSAGEAVFVLPSPCLEEQHELSRLTELLRCKRLGWRSWGSAGHDEGQCRPCSMAFRGVCRNGSACDRCHGEHYQKQIRGRKTLFAVGPDAGDEAGA